MVVDEATLGMDGRWGILMSRDVYVCELGAISNGGEKVVGVPFYMTHDLVLSFLTKSRGSRFIVVRSRLPLEADGTLLGALMGRRELVQ